MTELPIEAHAALEARLRNAIRTRDQKQLADSLEAMAKRGCAYTDVYRVAIRQEGLTVRQWERLLNDCGVRLQVGGISR